MSDAVTSITMGYWGFLLLSLLLANQAAPKSVRHVPWPSGDVLDVHAESGMGGEWYCVVKSFDDQDGSCIVVERKKKTNLLFFKRAIHLSDLLHWCTLTPDSKSGFLLIPTKSL